MEHKKNHIKLEDIKKDTVFHVPDKYFDDLPGIIQLKTTALPRKNKNFSWIYSTMSLKYAIPMVLLFVGLFFFLSPKSTTEIDISSLFRRRNT